MLNGGAALQIQVRISLLGQFNNILFISEGQALAERGLQVALKEAESELGGRSTTERQRSLGREQTVRMLRAESASHIRTVSTATPS